MPELSVLDLANTCVNLLLKGAGGPLSHDHQLLAGRVATAIPLVAERLLAEQREDVIADTDRAVDATLDDEREVAEVQQEVVETIDAFREELATRAGDLGRLSQEELNGLLGAVVDLRRNEEAAEPGELARSQAIAEEWRAMQEGLDADVARQRDALSLLAVDPARPGAIDLGEEQRAIARALDAEADAPGTLSDLAASLTEVEARLEALRAEQREAWRPDRHEDIVELDRRSDRLTVDAEVAMALLAHQVSQRLDECRAALQAGLERAPEGSTAAMRYEAALERLDPRFEPGPVEAASGRVVPWGPDVQRSACTADYLQSVAFHAQERQNDVWKAFELVADLKRDGIIGPDDPVSLGRAVFHMGSGSLAERTDAAHKLPGQLTIGLDTASLADARLAERFRLDNLVPAAEDVLRESVRGWFGTTTVTDLYVNAVDSLWEKKGLGEAFRSAVEQIVRQREDADRGAALDQAYARFRDDALAALDRAREHNDEALRELRRRPPAPDAHERTLTVEDRENMSRVLDEYQRMLEERRQEDLRRSVAWPRA